MMYDVSLSWRLQPLSRRPPPLPIRRSPTAGTASKPTDQWATGPGSACGFRESAPRSARCCYEAAHRGRKHAVAMK